MSVIFVFVGQCGNQVGSALTKTLAENCVVNRGSNSAAAPPQQQRNFNGPFFTQDGFVRAVLVDAEDKVVTQVAQRCGGLIRPSNLVTGRSGRGNSWSLGYCGLPETDEAEVQAGAFRVSTAKDQLERDRSVLCRALKAIHSETRRCDDGMVEAIVVLHSLAGGTGSGLGCALIENIRHHFCCDGADHDANDDEDAAAGGGGGDNDPLSFGAPFQSRSSKAAASARGTKKGGSPGNKRGGAAAAARDLPPSILDEDLIREGTFGEPRKARFVCSVCVAPHVQGELAVQSLNACLTLRTLVKNCDAVFLLRNDCQKLFRGLEHSHGASSSSSSRAGSAVETSFQAMNAFFASMLASAFQGGAVFGCIAELLDACVERVAGINWQAEQQGQQQQQQQQKQDGGRFSWNEFVGPDAQQQERSGGAGKRPRPGPRLLTLVPWDPRAPWAAGFRRSSVTATLCGRDTSRGADVFELLAAYLCNEVRGGGGGGNGAGGAAAGGLEKDLCSVLSRSGADAAAIGSAGAAATTGRGAAPSPASVSAVANKPVLVLNQCSELCTSVLLPFFRDAAAKVDSGAYMHTFNVRGILARMFSVSNNGNNNTNRGGGGGGRQYSPQRSTKAEVQHAAFARSFINSALVELLEYINASYPAM